MVQTRVTRQASIFDEIRKHPVEFAILSVWVWILSDWHLATRSHPMLQAPSVPANLLPAARLHVTVVGEVHK